MFVGLMYVNMVTSRSMCVFFSLQPSVRKTHNSGRKHKESVKLYYMNWLEREAQNMMEQPGQLALFMYHDTQTNV